MPLQKIYDKESGKTTYSFTEWYNKMFYWLGIIYSVLVIFFILDEIF